tara:strand:- start:394 stop:1374 length:981 start_codon:yes stop_codon:yes gene_type:complete
MDYLNLLVDTKKEFSIYLINNLAPEISKGIFSIYFNCKNRVEQNNNILISFQQVLSEVPNWNNNVIYTETNRIKNKISYIEDLLTSVFISNMRLLCSIKNKNKQIKIKVPKLEVFIHKCYIEVAKEFWSYTYLFNENINKLEVQKNKKHIEIIIKNSIEEVIRKLLPLKTILKDYLETNLDTETIDNPEIHNSLIDIIKNNIKPDEKNENQETDTEYNKPNSINETNTKKEFQEEIKLQTDINDLDVQSEFNFDENAFLNTISNNIVDDIIDNPNELYNSFEKTNEIKVVNLNSEDKINLNVSEKNTIDKDKNKNYLNNFQTHNTN